MPLYNDKKLIQGRFTPRHPQKYVGDPTNIIFRSGWELRFMRYCDTSSSIIRWGSEELVIPYRCKTDGNMHRYFVDFWVDVRQQDGTIRRKIIEIKPKKYTLPPQQPKRKTKRFVEEVLNYAKNTSKWDAARAYAKKHDCDFIILTEDTLL